MIILVCGGRDYSERAKVFAVLDEARPTLIVQGGARGADQLAREWAESRGIAQEQYDADWRAYGRAAGAIRNAQMLSEGKPDLVIAFPGGKGTANMIRKARRAGVPVKEIAP